MREITCVLCWIEAPWLEAACPPSAILSLAQLQDTLTSCQIIIKIKGVSKVFRMLDDDDGIYGMLTFLLEGVLLLAVALVGLIGNLISFVTIFRQKIQKTFHNLLFLLTVFDMVRVPAFLHSKCKSIALFSIHLYVVQRNSRCGCDVSTF